MRVLDGIAYVLDMFPGYQSRHRSTLHALARVIARFGPLPNLEVIIDVTDGELQKIDLPILVITHKKEAWWLRWMIVAALLVVWIPVWYSWVTTLKQTGVRLSRPRAEPRIPEDHTIGGYGIHVMCQAKST